MSEPKFTIVNKTEAASRQLDTAIWLWFNEGDLVSIVSLAGAAHGIFDDLLHETKKGRAIPFDSEPPAGMSAKDWLNLIKQSQVFAKHARQDHAKHGAYSVEETELFLWFVVLTNGRWTESVHFLPKLFAFWFGLQHPGTLPFSDRFTQRKEAADVDALKKLSRFKFFQKFGGEFVGSPPRPD